MPVTAVLTQYVGRWYINADCKIGWRNRRRIKRHVQDLGEPVTFLYWSSVDLGCFFIHFGPCLDQVVRELVEDIRSFTERLAVSQTDWV